MKILFSSSILALGFGLLSTSASADVAQVQQALGDVGCYDGPVDGQASLALRTATRCFQKSLGATPDGTLSDEEMSALMEAAASGSTVEQGERYDPAKTERELREAVSSTERPEVGPSIISSRPRVAAPAAPEASVTSSGASSSPDADQQASDFEWPWDYLDVATLGLEGEPYLLIDRLPGHEAVPDHPDWGVFVGMIGYGRRGERDWSGYAPLYLTLSGQGCDIMVLQTLVAPDAPPHTFRSADLQYGEISFLLNLLGQDQTGCPRRSQTDMMYRVVNEMTGEETFFRFDEEVPRQVVSTWMNAFRNPGAPQHVSDIPALGEFNQSGLRAGTAWGYYYNSLAFNVPGRNRRTPGALWEASVMLYALTLEYSAAAFDSNDACRYPGDVSGTMTRSVGSGGNMGTTSIRRAYYPPHQSERIRNVMEMRKGDTRGYVYDAEVIVKRDGCKGPQVALLRENLWRFLSGKDPMTMEEAAAIPRATPKSQAKAPARTPVARTDVNGYLSGCMRQYALLPEVSDNQVIACLCEEDLAMLAGDEEFYRNKVRDWFATPMPKFLVTQYNAQCGRPIEKQSARVQDHFRRLQR